MRQPHRAGRALRVLHVFHHIFRYACGYRTRSENIVRHQREHGIEPFVVTSSDHEQGRRLPDPDGLSVRHAADCRGPRLAGFREARLMSLLEREIAEAIGSFAPDLVHAHSPVLVALPALRAARRAKLPFVYEVRDLWENASVDLGKFAARSLRYRVARAVDGYVLRRADAVTVICDSMRQELAGRLGPAGRIFVAGNGVDLDALRVEDAASSRHRWKLPDRDVLGYIGMLQPYEGLDLLIAAMPAIMRARPGVHLLIAGDGNHEAALRARVWRLGLAAHVTFAGRIAHSEVSSAYAACDALVYPRHLTDTTRLTTPLKPLEAMALGKAVLASDLPPMRELVRDEVTGLLFRADDSSDLAARCSELLSNAPLRHRLGAAAREWVTRERQWHTMVGAYTQAYATAMGTSHQPGNEWAPTAVA